MNWPSAIVALTAFFFLPQTRGWAFAVIAVCAFLSTLGAVKS
jgi:hypothetical protein